MTPMPPEIPPRPWGVEIGENHLCVGSLVGSEVDEVVFYLNYDAKSGAHQPSEQARANFIVNAINCHDELLAALMAVLNCFHSSPPALTLSALLMADAAIKKAETTASKPMESGI